MSKGRAKAAWAPMSSLMALIYRYVGGLCGETEVKTAADFNPTVTKPPPAPIPQLTPEQTERVLKAVFVGGKCIEDK